MTVSHALISSLRHAFNLRNFRSSVGGFALLLLLSGIATASNPNVILIMADDVGYECFGCYGSKQYSTPNIDQLATQGMRFDHCYSQPLCTPSRVKLMTGLTNARNYSAFSVLTRDQKTIGQHFKNGGYETAVVGKWQLFGAKHYSKQFRGRGTMPNAAGFDHVCLWQVDQLGERYPGPLMWIDGENRQLLIGESVAHTEEVSGELCDVGRLDIGVVANLNQILLDGVEAVVQCCVTDGILGVLLGDLAAFL